GEVSHSLTWEAVSNCLIFFSSASRTGPWGTLGSSASSRAFSAAILSSKVWATDRRRCMTQPRCLRVPRPQGLQVPKILICPRTAVSSKVNTIQLRRCESGGQRGRRPWLDAGGRGLAEDLRYMAVERLLRHHP